MSDAAASRSVTRVGGRPCGPEHAAGEGGARARDGGHVTTFAGAQQARRGRSSTRVVGNIPAMLNTRAL